jgi:hypothetical protein
MWSARHPARARYSRFLGAVFVGTALGVGCSADRAFEPSDGDVSLAPASAEEIRLIGQPVPIEFATYENSRQVVHPSAVAFSQPWHGQRFWLALTPYPNSDSHVENPSLFGSTTGDAWSVPNGLRNPVAKTTRGYLSDPELAYDPTADELRLYYREVVEAHHRGNKPKHKADIVYLTRSSDGVHWSAAAALTNDVGHFVVSPTVTRRADGDWKMWAVDAGRAGCNSKDTRIILRRSVDGVAWSVPTRVAFAQPGYLPWHLDVRYVPELGSYWALVAAYPVGTACTVSSLFLATSADGVHWTTYASPALARGAIPQFSTNVYRSTFAFEPNGNDLTIWLTGATTVKPGDHRRPPVLRWSAAVWHTHADALLQYVRTAQRDLRIPADSEVSILRRLATDNALP